jgi:hypothetical protein
VSHVSQCKAVLKSAKDIEAAAVRMGGSVAWGKAKVKMYGSGFVDDSYQWREFFSAGEADRISRLPRDQRIKIINEVMASADGVINFPKASYNVGIYKLADNTFRLRYDEWGSGGLTPIMGQGGNRFAQAYSIESAKRVARARGYSTREVPQSNGRVQLEVLVR